MLRRYELRSPNSPQRHHVDLFVRLWANPTVVASCDGRARLITVIPANDIRLRPKFPGRLNASQTRHDDEDIATRAAPLDLDSVA